MPRKTCGVLAQYVMDIGEPFSPIEYGRVEMVLVVMGNNYIEWSDGVDHVQEPRLSLGLSAERQREPVGLPIVEKECAQFACPQQKG